MTASLFLVLLLGAVLACATAQSSYPFNHSNTLGDHAVLQRGRPASVWGFGRMFDPVAVTLTSNFVGASHPQVKLQVSGWVASTGIWRVQLPSQPAGGPYTITGSAAATGESWALSDIMFGDVYICGGQSNMAFGMGGIANASALISASESRPGIRILSPQYSAQNASQLQVVDEFGIKWATADPSTVVGFSAVCYLTAAGVYDAHSGSLPLGLIDTAVGGTAAQLWVPPLHLSDCGTLLSTGDIWHWPWSPSCWYNGMVAPFTIATEIKLFLWDQGENNVGERAMYECIFPTIIRTWREAFRAPDAPFLFVQLPAYMNAVGSRELAELREGQLAALALPGVGFVSTQDLGDAYEGSIHNRDKAPVAARLAAAVLASAYADEAKEVPPHLSPRYLGASAVTARNTTAGSTIVVTVRVGPPEALYGGLLWVPPSPDSNGTQCPTSRGVAEGFCDWFAVQTSDGTWYKAEAHLNLSKDAVVLFVEVPPGLTAVATRNGWADWPVTNVYNAAGLPLLTWTPRSIDTAEVLML